MTSQGKSSEVFLTEVESHLKKDESIELRSQNALEKILAWFEGSVGTIHGFDAGTNTLNLLAQKGLPEALLPKVKLIPMGKGMAGIAAQRKEPVQVCNLQTDASGIAKPSAKETKVEGSITVPLLVEGELRGTLGVAKPVVYEFNNEEISLLMKAGTLLGKYLGNPA